REDDRKEDRAENSAIEKLKVNAIPPTVSNDTRVGFSVNEASISLKKTELPTSIKQELGLNLLLSDNGRYLRNALEETRKTKKRITEAKEDINTKNGHRFSVALSFAPDVTALKIKDIAGLGNSVGFKLEYFILP